MKKQTLAIAAISFAAATASTQPAEGPPRGRDISSQAGNCNIGPFGQTAKAGPYNGLCETMTDAEKCLALIKGNMTSDYQFHRVNGDQIEIVGYCLEHLRSQLLPAPVQPPEPTPE